MPIFPAFAFFFAAKIGPELPPGSNTNFQKSCFAVQEAMCPFDFRRFPDFKKAENELLALPTKNLTIDWDDETVPAIRRAEFVRARDAAVKTWEAEIPGLSVAYRKGGRVKLSFAPELPPNADSAGPAGAVYMASPSPQDPTVEGVIALKRGEKGVSIEAKDVQNEVAYAIGSYFGLERSASPGTIMWRREEAYFAANRVSTEEGKLARENLAIVEQLASAVRARRTLIPAQPEIYLEPVELTTEPVVQGSMAQMSFQVFNRGNSRLRFRVTPDCGCFRVEYLGAVAPGESALVKVWVDTTEFPGELHKALYVYSNDPDTPTRRVPVKFYVEPLYHFLRKESSDILIAGKDGIQTEFFLDLNPKEPITVKAVEVDGVPATVSMTPWEGQMADPSLGEPMKPRKGFRFDVKVRGDLPLGRSAVTLVVKTTNDKFPLLRRTIYVQRGIAVLPFSVFFGEIGKNPERAWVLVSRPEQNFKVLKITSDNPAITAHVEPVRGVWEYKLVVEYNGKADFGALNATLELHTDDPDQPIITVPVSGTVR